MLLFCAERNIINYKTNNVCYSGEFMGCAMQNDHFSGDIHAIKYHRCPYCNHSARICADIDTESKPEVDEEGHYQYFCLNCGKTFLVEPPSILLQGVMN